MNKTAAVHKPASQSDRYHHGNLRAALLVAAEAELAENGIEHFSLRSVAKRAKVSHAAPAHHFTDSRGLLTALAAVGCRRLHAAQIEAMEEADESDDVALLAASGLGYVRFALANPALFRLIFSSGRPDHEDPELSETVETSYNMVVDLVEKASGDRARTTEQAERNIAATWAMAHGLSDLLVSGKLKSLIAMPVEDREAAIIDLMARTTERR